MNGTSTRRVVSVLVVAAAAFLLARPAEADLADLIPGLFARDLLLAPPAGPFPSHEAHFLDEAAALSSTGRLLNQSLVTQLSSFPLATSAAGFSYRFDPELGVPTRTTDTFAPIFTERAFTNGKGRWGFGLTHLRADYESLDGLDLAGDDIVFQLRHIDIPPAPNRLDPFFEGDLVSAEIALGVSTDTTVLFGSYGVTNRFDLAIALPVVEIELDAAATLTVDRLSTEGIPGIHRFEGELDRLTFSDNGFASGIGDVVVRGKLRVLDRAEGGLALLADVTLPTGDEDDLLGTGQTQGSLILIGSRKWEKVTGHFNLGYGSASGESNVVEDLPDELLANLALEFSASPRVTVVTEVIGRQLIDAPTIDRRFQSFNFRRPNGTTAVAERPVVTFSDQDQELVLGSFGAKWNVGGNLVLSPSLLTPLTEDGLVDGLVLVFGADLSF